MRERTHPGIDGLDRASTRAHPGVPPRRSVVFASSTYVTCRLRHVSSDRTHPSTRLIEEVLESIRRLGGVGSDVRKIIVADGVKVREASKFRAGVVSAEDEERYRHYLHRIHHLTKTSGSSLHGAELIALDERHGFAHALRRGLMRVATPFVLVAQHDRSFVREMDVEHVVDVMEKANEAAVVAEEERAAAGAPTNERTASGGAEDASRARRINYVGFPTATTITHAHHVRSKYALQVRPIELPVPPRPGRPPTLRLLPLLQFYDSMHVASTRWYLSRVFGRRRYVNMPRGGFIEDTLGQHMLAKMRGPEGVDAHVEFGTYMFQDDTGETKCGHIDGHDVLTESASCRKYGFSSAHTSRERWEEIENRRGAAYWSGSGGAGDASGDSGEAEVEAGRDVGQDAGAGAPPPYEMVVGFLDEVGSSRLPPEIQI